MLPGIEYIKTLLNGIMSRLRRVEKDVAETKTKAVNSDWNVHDPGDGAHVKNRPFYNDYVESMLLYRVNDPPKSGQGAAYLGIFESAFLVGKTYRVTLYGAGVNKGTYECKCTFGDGNNGTTVGKLYLLKSVGSNAINDGSIFQNPDTLEVFAWSWWDDATYTLTIEGPGYELKRIDKKFLPDSVTSFNGKTGDVSHLPIVSKGFTDPTVPSNTTKRDLLALGSTAVMLNGGNKGIYVNGRNDLCLLVGDNRQAYVVRGGVSYPIIDLASQDATLMNYIRRPNKASVGQAIVVKAVDKNGKPTEWETSDIATVDSTLTKSGQAADAAVVGNRLSALSEEIADSITAPARAEVGQTIVVKAVDENGKPTEWEMTEIGQNSPVSHAVVLSSSSWDSMTNSQIVTVSGVKALEGEQIIHPTPSLASQAAYYDAGILCTAQETDSLTFTAETVPTDDLTVYVVIQEVSQDDLQQP